MDQSMREGAPLRGRYWNDEVTITAAAGDHHLGSKGLFVACDARPAEGAILQFELAVGGEKPITGAVRVVEAVEAPEGADPERRRGVRVKFVRLDDVQEARALLARVDLPPSPSIAPPRPDPPPAPAGDPSVDDAWEAAAPPASETAPPAEASPTSSAPASSRGSKRGKQKRSRSSGSMKAVAAEAPPSSRGRSEAASAAIDEEATSQRWEAAMALDDEFFDRPPPSSRDFADEPTADSMLVRAADPVYRARRQRLQRTFAVVVAAAALVFVGAVALRGSTEVPARAADVPRGDVAPATAADVAPPPPATATATPTPPTTTTADPAPVDAAATASVASAAAPAAPPSAPPAVTPPPPKPAVKPPPPPLPKAPPAPKAPPPKTKPPASKPAAADIYE